MDGLGRAVGEGITSLVATAFEVIGDTLRGIVHVLERTLPGGWLFVVAFIALLGAAWVLAKR
jgi:hypothetical protein